MLFFLKFVAFMFVFDGFIKLFCVIHENNSRSLNSMQITDDYYMNQKT